MSFVLQNVSKSLKQSHLLSVYIAMQQLKIQSFVPGRVLFSTATQKIQNEREPTTVHLVTPQYYLA